MSVPRLKVTEHAPVGSGTLTLTPTLWSLLNVLPAHDAQRPHRHQSVALDFCVYAKVTPRLWSNFDERL